MAALKPLSIEEYPTGTSIRLADMTPLQRAFAEAEHDGCEDEPAGHPLSEHEPWDLTDDPTGVETWDSFMARLARHGIRLELIAADSQDVRR
jgi:hypothetical protein